MINDPMDARERPKQPPQFLNARLCGARTKSGKTLPFTSDEERALSLARRRKR
jgi:hypothetical protein